MGIEIGSEAAATASSPTPFGTLGNLAVLDKRTTRGKDNGSMMVRRRVP